MADNFLKKQYEQWKSGKTSTRRSTPSLDSLIKSLSGSGPNDPAYMVKKAQLDAIVRTASGLGGTIEFITDEESASITVSGDDMLLLGEAVLAIRLKAAELKLQAETDAASDSSITLKISKAI